MDVSNRICLIVGFFAGGFTILCSASVLTWVDKIRGSLHRRKGRHEILVATLRQISTQQQEGMQKLLEQMQELKTTPSAAPKRRSHTKKATHKQQQVNGKDETTEEQVQ
ncbi:MAG: hypothetical protein F6J86_06720 [Symploca sp. SIO1B1]|nr:hypothetical protein [Symploca sp. SIO1B1]